MNNRRQRQSIDGFALRRRPQQQLDPSRLGVDQPRIPNRFLRAGESTTPLQTGEQSLPSPKIEQKTESIQPDHPKLNRSEIDESLNAIDETSQPVKPKRRRLNKKLVKRIAIALAIIAVIIIGYIGIKALIASSKVFKGNLFDLLGSGQQLKTDEFGRSNILVFGTSEDDGPDHGGANLTDSIMVVSLDQKNKNAAMMSIPRDLWVKFGAACNAGYEGKVNEVYNCYSDEGQNDAKGAEALMKIVGENFGIDIQYYAHVNYTVVRQSVDAVGGVDITIESSDPRGILDRNFDWICRYQCYKVKYANGPVHLDGEHALYLARARNDPTGWSAYGLPQGNFDREKNQQKILTALKQKATSAGTLSNPVAVTNLIDSLGNNVRTNFSGGEVKTLIGLGKDIPNDKIKSVSLVEEGNMMVTTGNVSGQSIVRPVAGVYDFTQIQDYVRQKLNAMNGEAATVDVLNGSDGFGVATAKAKELKDEGMSVGVVADAPAGNYAPIQWYDLSKGKQPKTAAKLKQLLGVEAAGSSLPSGVQSTADFVIIVGNGAN
jgi:LCP family protein required for cell wall assembly